MIINKPLKLTIGIIISLIILFMGMKEVKAHSFPEGASEKVYEIHEFHFTVDRK